MTIYLPQDIHELKIAFLEKCDQILDSEKDLVFYGLLVRLIKCLQDHPLLKTHIAEWEAEAISKKEAFSVEMFKVLEETWMRCWGYHRHRLVWRKRLVQIKRVITSGSVGREPLYTRISSLLWGFCATSNFCGFVQAGHRMIRQVASELNAVLLPYKNKNMEHKAFWMLKHLSLDMQQGDHIVQSVWSTVRDIGLTTNIPLSKWRFEYPLDCLFSLYAFEDKHQISGKYHVGKRCDSVALAIIDAAYCWERMQLLIKWDSWQDSLPERKKFIGKWLLIRKPALEAADEWCEREAVLIGTLRKRQGISAQAGVTRMDYEKYLGAFKNHVRMLVQKVEDALSNQNDLSDAIDSELRADELERNPRLAVSLRLMRRYKARYPKAKNPDAYKYYCENLKGFEPYAFPYFQRLLVLQKIDLRPRQEKVRGKSCKIDQK